ncbi:aminoglycoside phosphotransferase family protein [Actinokineospora sp. NBRC 105648]|uniref:aminoglycoside phosphotransferase family protein n=1 Tax=Actinokineospora sp. NBRC 105648 TaxID=3032206 RepID=UPI0024A1D682|nr:aminoglycoside phosphotransferase family protein [Actinokineospora sp. NBRC 105648]GLZ43222.1 aminoglycoside O-phosphotransferase [Actinokineospora sp. NBRC 105648]
MATATPLVPPSFGRYLTEPAQRRWLAALPELARHHLGRWDLTRDGPTLYGHTAIVLPVRRADGAPAVLKLGLPHREAAHEALGLSLWDGDGAVRLLDHDADDWALLLERLDPHHSLDDEPLAAALEVVAALVRRLDRPAPAGVRTLAEIAERWAATFPLDNADGRVPAELVEQAVAYCRELGPTSAARLVNEDLHFENVLRADREPWLVIDPKPLSGDPEFGLIPLLTNRIDESDPVERLAWLVEATGADPDRARRWTFVRALDDWIDGEDDTNPAVAGAPRIARALA